MKYLIFQKNYVCFLQGEQREKRIFLVDDLFILLLLFAQREQILSVKLEIYFLNPIRYFYLILFKFF